MSAQLLDGTTAASEILASLPARIELLGHSPTLATVLVGDDPASRTYVAMKRRRAATVGIRTQLVELPSSVDTDTVVATVRDLDSDPGVDGILVQHPLPDHIGERRVFDTISTSKDVDGVTSASFASMSLDGSGFRSATPGGIMTLLDHHGIDLRGRRAVVVGRSHILGLPMTIATLLEQTVLAAQHSSPRHDSRDRLQQ